MDFKNKPIIGMIHLAGYGQDAVDRALFEIDIFEQNGVDACIIENYHNSTKVVIDTFIALAKDYRVQRSRMEFGVNILPNNYIEAFQIAHIFNASFIQLDNIAGEYDNVEPFPVWDYLHQKDQYPHIQVLGGVWPKYYYPKKDSSLSAALIEGKLRCDAIVVTGEGTGKETPLLKIKDFRSKIDKYPLIIGAGLNMENVEEQIAIADGAIVGSCFKPNNSTSALVDDELVKKFMDKVNKVRNGTNII